MSVRQGCYGPGGVPAARPRARDQARDRGDRGDRGDRSDQDRDQDQGGAREAPERPLLLANGDEVAPLDLRVDMFLNRTTVIYGPTNTGKTVIAKNIMHLLKDHVPIAIAVSPTEPSNHSYRGIIDLPLVHHRLFLPNPQNPRKDDGTAGALRFMNELLLRQEAATAVCDRVNRPEVLERAFGRLPIRARARAEAELSAFRERRRRMTGAVERELAADPGRMHERLRSLEEQLREILVLLYKKFLTPHCEELLASQELDKAERYALYNLHFNPRVLLIMDDCAAECKPLFKKEVFRKLFYQGRHSNVSAILVCQDDTDLDTNLRKGAFINFFTSAQVAQSNFNRAANQFSKQLRRRMDGIIPEVFDPDARRRVLVWLRDDPTGRNVYHTTFKVPPPFRFGSRALWALNDAVEAAGGDVDADNPYASRFEPPAPPADEPAGPPGAD